MAKDKGAYDRIIEKIFLDHYQNDHAEFVFIRREIIAAKEQLAPDLDLNPGDVPYSYRYRRALPEKIQATQPTGKEWIIEGAGRSKYRFKLVPATRILPNPNLAEIAIPDATPEIIRAYALDDEQALLAILRYNRLLDTFLSLTTYSLQNHLRTSVKGIGQIEIDELYIGIDTYGCHYIIPVQAKGGKDQIGVVQTTQDIRFAESKFPEMRCKAVSAQFMDNGAVALFDLTIQREEVKIVDERHYRLIPANELDQKAIRDYRPD
ncbi:endonuclease [Tsuneonella suprasediminis]|uniref:Endonuclease n=1 Tax=Tsuneonella suprasediminis TaxID=2306996 RepID=A0A419QZZ8_9SPHN|nr:endonuclease [Tsuneonella suprasediminis]RJX66832.1 endonuclease [Tsuneonella suprasediminis]